MRSLSRTIRRCEHWRWQRCGPGRSELRRVFVRGTAVTLSPDIDARQADLLEKNNTLPFARNSKRRTGGHGAQPDFHIDERPVLRSYWRRQPYGPKSTMRKMILVDVRATTPLA